MLTEKSYTGHAVVIGSGVMGGGIAAWLANLGWQVSLLDTVPGDAEAKPESRNRLAREGLDRTAKVRPPQFTSSEAQSRIRIGNVEDHLGWAADADWVIEAIAETPEAKRSLFQKLAEVVSPQAILSSNTSGLSLADMVAGCPSELKRRFLGTHFFNPPRYMKPVELIPTEDTDPALFEAMARFCDKVLGKRVVRAKDTPGFISTRLGIYNLAMTMQLAIERNLPIELVDYLTGPLIGRPKSGTFRLADVVGIDITSKIAENLKMALPSDPVYQALELPSIVGDLTASGRVGQKAGAGFYRREPNGSISVLDWGTGDYRSQREFEQFDEAIERLPIAERLTAIWDACPKVDGGFLRDAFTSILGYSANIAPEISDRIVEVDDALISGFGWELGPFHLLDILGSRIEWPDDEPKVVKRLRETGQPRYYSNLNGKHFYFDFETGKTLPLMIPAECIRIKDLRKAGKTVLESDNASLVDLGDGVACFEWRTKMGTLSGELLDFLSECHSHAEEQFTALVIGTGEGVFSAGFDLRIFLKQLDKQDWPALDAALRHFQQTNLKLRRGAIPVVAAVSGYTLGGGCELALHCHGMQAQFETAIGLPEANVGLVPAGGGIARLLERALKHVPQGTILDPADPYPHIHSAWNQMRQANFSGSAIEGQSMGYLDEQDGMTVHPDHVLHDAKVRALGLSAGFRPNASVQLHAMGQAGFARFQWEIHLARTSGFITEQDTLVAEKIAWVLCGGGLLAPTQLSEERFMELEREAFLSLCGTAATRARIVNMLETGKPLRN